MRILISSDAPFQPSSWGQQVKLIGPRLQAAGHEVIVHAPTYYGEELQYEGLTILGGNGDTRGDLLPEYAERAGADVLITMKGLHVYNAASLRRLRVPWLPLVAVETEPLSAVDRGQLSFATMPLAMARHGQQAMAEYGIRSLYTPLGIDTAFWTPGDKVEARARWRIPPTAFVAAFVGRNGRRKAIDQLLIAWASFIELVPETMDAVLILHTDLEGHEAFDPIDLPGLLTTLDMPSINLRVTDQLGLHSGTVPAEYVRDIYRAADVLCMATEAEGCGLPLIEAQACGTPPIATQFTAMRELNWSGWMVATDPDKQGGERVWHNSGGFRFRPSVRAIVQCLMMAGHKRGDPALVSAATRGAQAYDIDHVVSTHWLPALEQVESLLRGAKVFAVPEVPA